MTPQKEPVSPSIRVHDTVGARRPLIGIRASHHAPPTLPAAVADEQFDVCTHALAAAGGAPIGIPLNLAEDALRAIFERLNGLCLPGGADVNPAYYGQTPHPELGEAAWGVEADSDATEFLITRWALDARMPILGFCRGIQVLNVAAGGTLYQDIVAQVPGAERHAFSPADTPWELTTHRVCLTPDSQLARILGATEVWTNSFHHQAIKDVAPWFRRVRPGSRWLDRGDRSGLAPVCRRRSMASRMAV